MGKLSFLESKSGVGTVVGAIIATTIIMLIISGVFLWSATVTQYMTNLDRERISEDLAVYTYWQEENGSYIYNVDVENTGSIDVKLVSIWLIENYTGHPQKHIMDEFDPPLDIVIGEKENVYNGTLEYNPKDVPYLVKVITGRGNIFSSAITQYAEENVTTIFPLTVDSTESQASLLVKGNKKTAVFNLTIQNNSNTPITVQYLIIGPLYLEENSEGYPGKTLIKEVNWTIEAGEEETFSTELTSIPPQWSDVNYVRLDLIFDELTLVAAVVLPFSK